METKSISLIESQIKILTRAHTVASLVAVKNPTERNIMHYQSLNERLDDLIKKYKPIKEVNCCKSINKDLTQLIVNQTKQLLRILN